jgi:hypothetical protein
VRRVAVVVARRRQRKGGCQLLQHPSQHLQHLLKRGPAGGRWAGRQEGEAGG